MTGPQAHLRLKRSLHVALELVEGDIGARQPLHNVLPIAALAPHKDLCLSSWTCDSYLAAWDRALKRITELLAPHALSERGSTTRFNGRQSRDTKGSTPWSPECPTRNPT